MTGLSASVLARTPSGLRPQRIAELARALFGALRLPSPGLPSADLPSPGRALAGWRRARHEHDLLGFDERILRDIGAPERLIERARALRENERSAQAIARRLDFLR
ncbi:hypothetical protein M6I34_12835 [Burkholderiaceae bacterium FT117]|uniref:hypothetical protein n=1 Tax=Zeimonas sediminis TaxID=2944268 RepID=UPI002342EC1D|nr:hypothetical protein [Zeimonas sediminis]MCM5571397.1 hypothetical protein [Zeimonas sediminis]